MLYHLIKMSLFDPYALYFSTNYDTRYGQVMQKKLQPTLVNPTNYLRGTTREDVAKSYNNKGFYVKEFEEFEFVWRHNFEVDTVSMVLPTSTNMNLHDCYNGLYSQEWFADNRVYDSIETTATIYLHSIMIDAAPVPMEPQFTQFRFCSTRGNQDYAWGIDIRQYYSTSTYLYHVSGIENPANTYETSNYPTGAFQAMRVKTSSGDATYSFGYLVPDQTWTSINPTFMNELNTNINIRYPQDFVPPTDCLAKKEFTLHGPQELFEFLQDPGESGFYPMWCFVPGTTTRLHIMAVADTVFHVKVPALTGW